MLEVRKMNLKSIIVSIIYLIFYIDDDSNPFEEYINLNTGSFNDCHYRDESFPQMDFLNI